VFVYSRFVENPLIWFWQTNPSFLSRFYHTLWTILPYTLELVWIRWKSYLWSRYCDRSRREGETNQCQRLPNPVKRATTTRDIMHWSLKLVTTYTFESLRWKMYVVWHQREASSSLHWSVSYPWEVWTSDIPSGATAKIVRCAQRIPCISTQKMSEAPDGCGNWR
jgi:hypothetical protein